MMDMAKGLVQTDTSILLLKVLFSLSLSLSLSLYSLLQGFIIIRVEEEEE